MTPEQLKTIKGAAVAIGAAFPVLGPATIVLSSILPLFRRAGVDDADAAEAIAEIQKAIEASRARGDDARATLQDEIDNLAFVDE